MRLAYREPAKDWEVDWLVWKGAWSFLSLRWYSQRLTVTPSLLGNTHSLLRLCILSPGGPGSCLGPGQGSSGPEHSWKQKLSQGGRNMDWDNSAKYLETGPSSRPLKIRLNIFCSGTDGRGDFGNLGAASDFHPNQPHHILPCLGPWNAFLVTPWKNTISNSTNHDKVMNSGW